MKAVSHMLVMDVDGVITNLKHKKARPKVLQSIRRELMNWPLALNTGRASKTVMERVINPLIKNQPDKSFLKNLLIVAEKGAVWITFDQNGVPEERVETVYRVPDRLQEKIKDLVSAKYSHSMFFDNNKATTASVEMNDGYSLEEYQKDQKTLIPKVNRFIQDLGLGKSIQLDSNQIAIDVEDKRVGKHLGMQRVLDWLSRERKIKVNRFSTIGDNLSDFKMAEELCQNNLLVTHVHVGEKDIERKYPFKIIVTAKKYEEGTEEFLQALENKPKT